MLNLRLQINRQIIKINNKEGNKKHNKNKSSDLKKNTNDLIHFLPGNTELRLVHAEVSSWIVEIVVLDSETTETRLERKRKHMSTW